MKLWHIQASTSGYDVFSDAVVAAETKEEAAATHPSGGPLEERFSSSWVTSPEEVTVTFLGEASPELNLKNKEVICASFNAG